MTEVNPETIEIFISEKDGVELKIFKTFNPKLPFGFLYFDTDANDAVHCIHCKTLERVQVEFNKCKNALLKKE